MFEQLKRVLREAPRATPADDEQLAVAVLLLEVARADYAHTEAERAALSEGLAREFGLPPEALATLLDRAELRAKQSVSLFEFVQTLNRTLSAERKRSLMELLWRVAHADGRVDPHEEHLLRRLADLLHIPHAEFIRAKLKGQ